MKQENLVRINSRIRKEQFKFVKELAKERKIGEGEAHRLIIDEFIMTRESKKNAK